MNPVIRQTPTSDMFVDMICPHTQKPSTEGHRKHTI